MGSNVKLHPNIHLKTNTLNLGQLKLKDIDLHIEEEQKPQDKIITVTKNKKISNNNYELF